MPVLLLLAAMILCCSCSYVAHAELFDADKFHLVDYMPQSNAFLFRGNQPSIKLSNGKETFAYNEVLSAMSARAQSQANVTFPPANRVYIVDISFEWPFESGVLPNMEFFAANPKLGKFMEWILIGQVLEPNSVSEQERNELLQNGTLWKTDKIPERLQLLRQMMMAGPPEGYSALGIVGHCSAGCDRTGEFMMAYQMTYAPKYTNGRLANFTQIYDQDCTLDYGCGRCSNYFGTSGAAWYCLYWSMFNATQSGAKPFTDCMTPYKCELFKSCKQNN